MTPIVQLGIDLQDHLLLLMSFPSTSKTEEAPPGPCPSPPCLEPGPDHLSAIEAIFSMAEIRCLYLKHTESVFS